MPIGPAWIPQPGDDDPDGNPYGGPPVHDIDPGMDPSYHAWAPSPPMSLFAGTSVPPAPQEPVARVVPRRGQNMGPAYAPRRRPASSDPGLPAHSSPPLRLDGGDFLPRHPGWTPPPPDFNLMDPYYYNKHDPALLIQPALRPEVMYGRPMHDPLFGGPHDPRLDMSAGLEARAMHPSDSTAARPHYTREQLAKMDAASLAALALRPRAPELRRQWRMNPASLPLRAHDHPTHAQALAARALRPRSAPGASSSPASGTFLRSGPRSAAELAKLDPSTLAALTLQPRGPLMKQQWQRQQQAQKMGTHSQSRSGLNAGAMTRTDAPNAKAGDDSAPSPTFVPASLPSHDFTTDPDSLLQPPSPAFTNGTSPRGPLPYGKSGIDTSAALDNSAPASDPSVSADPPKNNFPLPASGKKTDPNAATGLEMTAQPSIPKSPWDVIDPRTAGHPWPGQTFVGDKNRRDAVNFMGSALHQDPFSALPGTSTVPSTAQGAVDAWNRGIKIMQEEYIPASHATTEAARSGNERDYKKAQANQDSIYKRANDAISLAQAYNMAARDLGRNDLSQDDLRDWVTSQAQILKDQVKETGAMAAPDIDPTFVAGGMFANAVKSGVARSLATDAASGSSWTNRLPGIQVRRIGDWWVKRVNPDANPIARWWGKKTIDGQAEALGQLGDMVTPFEYRNGALFTKDVGPVLGNGFRAFNSAARKAYMEGSKRLGTYINDIRPGNMGANGLIFDPAIDPITRNVFKAGVATVPPAAGVGTYYLSKRRE